MWKSVFNKALFVSALLMGVAYAQPTPPSTLSVGTTRVLGSVSGDCLTVVNNVLQNSSCSLGSVVPPSGGGTGTSTVFTIGSLPFAGASGVYQQDNANLFYDVTNKRLGIGTASPATMLHIVGKNNSGDGVLVDSTTQARVMVNNTSGGASKLASVVFAKNGTAAWTLENDISGAGTQNFNIFDNGASVNRLQIDGSGNVFALSGSVSSVAAHVAFSGSAVTAGGTTGRGYLFSSTTNLGLFYGSGAPTLSAAQGSLYIRTDGTPYYNNNGTTGWSSLAAGSGTVNAGTINQLGWYAGSGSAVSGLATANSGVLVTSGAGVPSISTVVPNGVTGTTQTSSDNSTLLATDAFVQAVATAASLISTPIGVCLPYGGASAPNASWVLADGSAINRTTFATAFGVFGVVYGSGNGTTTFNVPDLRGRAAIGADLSAGRVTTATLSAVTPGGNGGAQTSTAATTSTGTNLINFGSVNGATAGGWGGVTSAAAGADFVALTNSAASAVSTTISSSFGITVSGTSSAFTNMQPTLVMNYICRVQ